LEEDLQEREPGAEQVEDAGLPSAEEKISGCFETNATSS
jgi:hypothetical protein